MLEAFVLNDFERILLTIWRRIHPLPDATHTTRGVAEEEMWQPRRRNATYMEWMTKRDQERPFSRTRRMKSSRNERVSKLRTFERGAHTQRWSYSRTEGCDQRDYKKVSLRGTLAQTVSSTVFCRFAGVPQPGFSYHRRSLTDTLSGQNMSNVNDNWVRLRITDLHGKGHEAPAEGLETTLWCPAYRRECQETGTPCYSPENLQQNEGQNRAS